jgi:hypothetical protein
VAAAGTGEDPAGRTGHGAVRGEHGTGLDPVLERRLRRPPPVGTQRWVAHAVAGPDAEVVGVAALVGGISSAVHRLDVADGRVTGSRDRAHLRDPAYRRDPAWRPDPAVGRDPTRRRGGLGAQLSVVVRRFVLARWPADEPDAARRESVALRLAAGADVATPALLAVDPDGVATDVPTVVMSRLDGRHEWHPGVLAVPAGSLPGYAPYPLDATRPPAWSGRPDVWERGVEAVRSRAGGGPARRRAAGPAGRLVHRDFHPGNVLWRRGRVSGVVDWVNASVGDAYADVGHCRWNLLALGPDVPDRFLARWAAHAGRSAADYDRWWDLAGLLGGVDDAGMDRFTPRHEEWIRQALSHL